MVVLGGGAVSHERGTPVGAGGPKCLKLVEPRLVLHEANRSASTLNPNP
jgi:hypothetical protein